jgi:hypothetical protein
MENEIWKDVPGYAGIYQVSNLGRVKSLQRVISRENGWKQTINERFLKQANLNGYKIVGLRKKDFHKTYLVHVLIAKSFIENPHKKQFVDHIDTNRRNNNVSNLRWVTRLENNNNPITLSKLKLSARVISKPVLHLKNGVIVKEYNSINEAAKINGFSPIAICKVCKGERKNHKGYSGGIKMKRREISSSGNIGNDGKLRMYFGELNQFFAMHKGSRIIARFTVASPGSSEALKGYYFNYVVPTFRTGIWEAGERLTEEQTERRLRELSPVMYEQTPDINTGKYETRLRTIAELSNAELIEHIEHLKQIAAEEYNTFIDDPKSF